MADDRRTGINGDQINDETITRDELKFENSSTEDSLVAVNQSTGEFTYKSFPVSLKHFLEVSSLTLSKTTATSFQQKLRLTASNLSIGKYRLGWSYSWQYGLSSNDFKARIQIDDTNTVMEHQEEPKDQYSNQIKYCSGFLYFSIASEQSINIDLDYCGNSGSTASIFNARLEIWRVS